ncbi:magnesium transporter [Nafulsella turpanensis]|uniref:magnesium transporter n=1 Tax=Nafulsella turpanensis TaxID=1265690 RepID=UPI00034B2E72
MEQAAEVTQFQLSKEFLERLEQAVKEQDTAFIQDSLAQVKPADISAILHEFDAEESKFIFDLLPVEKAAVILSELDEDVRVNFLKNFSSEEIAPYVEQLDSDDAVDLLNEQSVKTREEVIANLNNTEKVDHIVDLLHYEEDCAGGLMAKELIKANINWTVTQTIEEIRRQAENVSKIYSVYVVDDDEKLLGKVSLKRMLLSRAGTRIADIYDPEIICVQTYMEEEEVASMMRKYDLEAVPVVNVQNKLVGRITIDDVVDVITELAEEERQMMSGITEDVEESDSVWRISRARLPWLVIGMVGGILAARFIGVFESDIEIVPALAFYIPLITATGGNVGIQSSSIILQSLANPSVFSESVWKRLLKVLMVAIFNGLILALLVLAAVLLIGSETKLVFVVSIALFCVVLLASFMGTITPLVLDHFGINPALASGPFITTANDLLGLGVYFAVAHMLFNL